MKNLLILFLLLVIPTMACAVKVQDLPPNNSPTSDDLLITVDAPSGAATMSKTPLSGVRDAILSGNGSNLTGLTASQISGNLPETQISFTDVTTGDVSTSKHGFAPKAPNDATYYLDGTGAYSVPSTAAAGGFTDGGTFVYTTTATDNVGIGTTLQTGSAKLSVLGSVYASGGFTGNASTATTATTATALIANGANCSTGSAPLGVDAAGAVEGCFTVTRPTDIDTSAEIAALVTDETGTGALVFATGPKLAANVGIGSATPGAALDVQGTVRATAFSGNGANITGLGGWKLSGTNIYQETITNNVGIGTALPTAILDVGTGHAFQVDSTGLLTINGGANPSLSSFGHLSSDNNIWASGRGAPVFFDGTATVALIGTLTSVSPSNGQVPTWNTGGTITWQTPASGGASITAADTQVIFSDGANNPVGDSGLVFNKTSKTLTTDNFQTTPSQYPALFLAGTGTDTDWVMGVSGNGGTDDDPLRIGIGTTVPDMSVKIGIKQDGNVGIGTSTAPNVLYVAGTTETRGFKLNTTAASGSVLVSNGVGVGTWMPATTLPAGGGSGIVTSSTINQVAKYNATGTTVIGSTVLSEEGTNVGIGTTSARSLLEVGTAKFNVLAGGNVGVGTLIPPNKLYVAGTAEMQGFKLPNPPSSSSVLVSNSVGVGTWMPASTLPAGSGSGTVNSATAAQVAYYPTSTNTVSGASTFTYDGGNVGIGTTVPGSIGWATHLEIRDNSTTNLNGLYIGSTTGATSIGLEGPTSAKTVNISLFDNNGGATVTQKAGISLSRDSSPVITGSGRNDLAIFTSSGAGTKMFLATEGSATNGITINSSGNVGIGTHTPKSKFEVKGGDVYLNTTAAKIYLRTPDGTCCYLSASDSDVLSCTSASCP